LKNYTNFNGRARRKEFWMFTLINFIINVILNVINNGIGIFWIISILYSVAIIIPGLAVSVRRMHDIGKSGWVILLALIPIVGAIILLVWTAKEGDVATNEYGENPKLVDEEKETSNKKGGI
jgi:uncharacterized membrane protein YhaH (DUF805 family)